MYLVIAAVLFVSFLTLVLLAPLVGEEGRVD